MNNLSCFRCQIARHAVDPIGTSLIADLLDAASLLDLTCVSRELLDHTYSIGEHPRGSGLLQKLWSKLNDSGLDHELGLFFYAYTTHPEIVTATLRHEIGRQTFFRIIDFSGNIEEFVSLLKDSVLIEIMTETDNIEPLFWFLFQNLNVLQLEPFLRNLSQQITLLSQNTTGAKNLNILISSSTVELQMCMISEINVIDIACDRNGDCFLQSLIVLHNRASEYLVGQLAGKFPRLSFRPYGSYVIQSVFKLGSQRNASFILYELTPFLFDLVRHRYGNYVFQSIVKRLCVMDVTECKKLTSLIIRRADDLKSHPYGKEVLTTCIYCERWMRD